MSLAIYLNPGKSGHAFAEKQRNLRSFSSRFVFMVIIFVCTFFKDANFVIFNVAGYIFLVCSLNIFCGIIGI